MLIKVDFYLLQEPTWVESRLFICRLIAKIYKQKQHKIYVRVDSAENAQLVYDSLWTFNDISFIPHQMAEETEITAPIVIGTDAPDGEFDIIMNLTQNAADPGNASRILEVIPNDETLKTVGRRKYKHYQAKEYDLSAHNIDE